MEVHRRRPSRYSQSNTDREVDFGDTVMNELEFFELCQKEMVQNDKSSLKSKLTEKK